LSDGPTRELEVGFSLQVEARSLAASWLSSSCWIWIAKQWSRKGDWFQWYNPVFGTHLHMFSLWQLTYKHL
jgi:hypothetical protein